MDLGNFSGLENGIGHAAERRPDVEGEYETASVADVGFAGTRGGFHGARSRGELSRSGRGEDNR